MILEMDLGNTRCKWRLREGSEVAMRGAIPISESFGELELPLRQYKQQIKKCWVVSVVHPGIDNALSRWVSGYLAINPEFARTGKTCTGIVNGYEKPESLGVDRWLAIVAAGREITSSFLMVSFGTAVTLDLVLENGQHVGGYIAPGLNLMLDSLQQGTYGVAAESNDPKMELFPGTTTVDAVHAAIAAMVVGLIENALSKLQEISGRQLTELIFTGGDAIKFLPLYPDAKYKPELVLDGLAFVLGASQ